MYSYDNYLTGNHEISLVVTVSHHFYRFQLKAKGRNSCEKKSSTIFCYCVFDAFYAYMSHLYTHKHMHIQEKNAYIEPLSKKKPYTNIRSIDMHTYDITYTINLMTTTSIPLNNYKKQNNYRIIIYLIKLAKSSDKYCLQISLIKWKRNNPHKNLFMYVIPYNLLLFDCIFLLFAWQKRSYPPCARV